MELSEDEYQDGDEGCLSVPELWFPTKRAWYARAEGIDLDGKKKIDLAAMYQPHSLDLESFGLPDIAVCGQLGIETPLLCRNECLVVLV